LKEEGRRKKEEGRGKKEERRRTIFPLPPSPTLPLPPPPVR